MSTSSDQTVRVTCDSCGGKFRSPASKAGQRGPCPKCGNLLVVPFADSAAMGDVDWSMVDAGASAGQDDYGGYDLAEGDEPVPARRGPVPTAAPAGLAGGGAAQYVPPGHMTVPPLHREASSAGPGAGRFMLGTGLAIVFGGVAAVLWIIIILVTGAEFGIAAIGLGAAVGTGMILGYGHRSPAAGAVASCLAVGGILMTKAIPAALMALLGLGVSAVGSLAISPYSPATARAQLSQDLVPEILAEQGLDYAYTSTEQDAAALVTAQERIAGWDDAEVELQFKRQQVIACREVEALTLILHDPEAASPDYADLRASVSGMTLADCDAFLSSWEPPRGPGFWSTFGQMFSPYDALWMFLALGMAFKICGDT